MNLLQGKIDEFIKKFYVNRLIQGLLVGFGMVVAYFLIANFLEYIGHFGKGFRLFLFYGFVSLAIFVSVRFWVIPILKIFKIGKRIDEKEASMMIGLHFPEIKDKLLNTLQLQGQSNGSNDELLIASIEQRIKNLSPVPFSSAIDLNVSFKKYVKYSALPLFILLLILVFQSSMITLPAKRILSYNKDFVREAPFQFILKNKNLEVLKNADFNIEVMLKGEKIPSTLFVELDGHLIKMEKGSKNEFSYHLSNLNANHVFKFTDGEFFSNDYSISVLPNPTLVNFEVFLKYPSHTGKSNETLKNTGDFTIPEGTVAEWRMKTKDAENVQFSFENQLAKIEKQEENFVVNAKVMNSVNYTIQLMNHFVSSKDTIHYKIQTVPDRFPGIAAEQSKDSINPYVMYFYGKADDDYGLTRLQFIYRNLKDGVLKSMPVSIGKGTDEIFYYKIDLRSLSSEGDELEYYFEVWDNDAVNGKKSSKSQVFKSVAPDAKDLRAETESGNKSMKSKMASAMKDLENLQKKSNELIRDLTEKNTIDWNQEQKLKDFLAEQKKLEKKVEDIKKENDLLNEKQKQLDPLDQELLEKQKELDKLMNELMNPETKELLKKLEELMKKQKSDEIKDQIEKMKMSNEEMKKQLDRNLEQFKKFEIEKKLEEQSSALEKLSEKQEKLSKETEEKTSSKEELKAKQDKLNQEFNDLKKEMDEINKKNEELESPLNLEDNKEEEEGIKNEMEESSDDISKKQNKKAAQKQKSAAQNMKKLAEKMKKSLEEAEKEQQEEDYQTLRQLLENLIELSTQQEDLMNQMKENKYYSPKYVELTSKQQKIKEMMKSVEDSLVALSKRQIQIKNIVNKELSSINSYLKSAIDNFSKVNARDGISNQQYVMTGMNNLAALLSESLKNMQESMNEKNQKNKGNQQCDNPGNKKGKGQGKPKAGGLKQMQDDLNSQIKKMMEGKKEGNNPNSEMYAKIAARQEMIRRELEKLEKMLKEEGNNGKLGDLNKTKEMMEQLEKELVNKQISNETLKRLKDIETRMLEHEKAEREQDMDNNREAEQAKEVEREIPPAIKSYLEKKAREMELIRSVPTELTPYYKDRVRVYFQKLGNS